MIFLTYIWASDPHGTGTKWIELIEKAKAKYPNSQLVLGGDYIDGRKNSRDTLDYVIHEYLKGAVVLPGNHEDLMVDWVENTGIYDLDLWLYNGGKTTVRSLLGRSFSNTTKAKELLKQNKEYQFIKELISKGKDMYETENIIFTHAGISDTTTNFHAKLWLREEYIYQDKMYLSKKDNTTPFYNAWKHNLTGKSIVTGHTPTCMIVGSYDTFGTFVKNIPSITRLEMHPKSYNCPVLTVQYPEEAPKYFTDNGCHAGLPNHFGNICVFNDKGKLVEVFS